ncbi:GTPase IMAP family member 8-like isoform X2 [Pseudorasbora parva]|uniref:GTPase IMAP family member 8-like isoform X2 n=1 Tax=Pseudorasbora parva TaxID=51549 RepID=UPI00351F7D12
MEEEVRVVVLGWQKSDKASVINWILGGEVASDEYFVKSVREDGEANGRKIALINTPCWWESFGLQDSPEVVKQELVCSVFKCPPGPHVFLLVINLSLPFTEENRFSIEKHFSLFGEKIWRHTIVLFTQADSSSTDKCPEQRIKSHGEHLQQILQRCGETYHILENEKKSAGVQDLLVKIDGVVERNSGNHFETHDEMLQEMRRKRNENEERAKDRQEMLLDKRKLLKELTVAPVSEMRIVLLGWLLSGKSSTIDTIFNNEKFETEGTEKCLKYSGEVNGKNITVLDTPGWWKYFSSKFNPRFAQEAILESIGQSQHMRFPHAMILVIPVDTSFKNEQKRIIEEYMAILGEDVWRHTIVLFTWGDRFKDVSIEQHIESEGEALQWLIEKCRNRYHVFDNSNKTNRAQVAELLLKIDEMVAENCLFRLDTQCPADAQVSDTQLDEKMSTDQVEELINQELNNRCNAIKRRIKELGKNFLGCEDEESDAGIEVKSDSSMVDTPSFSADEKLMELIRREGSRWEAIIMDGLLNILQNPEAARDGKMSQSSDEMVLMWLQKCEEHSQVWTGAKTQPRHSSP